MPQRCLVPSSVVEKMTFTGHLGLARGYFKGL
jgi:hypothetical protein